MEGKLGVLVVDDSAFMRKSISDLIETSSKLYVIGKARNGKDAIEKIKRLRPQVVTMDIEMPELNGIDTLKILMDENPIPVVMLSNGADSTLEAFELGAVDFVLKNSLLQEPSDQTINEFTQRIISAASANLHIPVKKVKEPDVSKEDNDNEVFAYENYKRDLIIIGSSTGGPAALQTILTCFPKGFQIPIVVIQHMPPGFTKPLAERFDSLCDLRVKEAEHNEVLVPGTIYIAPAGLQTTIQKNNLQYVIKLKVYTPIETLYKPSVDVTLLSIAKYIKSHLLTVILTGMGDDGLRGCKIVKESGGFILAEAEESCIVYGMPKVVYEAGLVDKQVPLQNMFEQIIEAL